MNQREKITLFPLGSIKEFEDVLYQDQEEMTLGDLLVQAPALSTTCITPELMDRKLAQLRLSISDTPLYQPPGVILESSGKQISKAEKPDTLPVPKTDSGQLPGPSESQLQHGILNEKNAVILAYAREIEDIASFLSTGDGLSVLISCDKLIVEHLWPEMVRKAGREAVVTEVPVDDDTGGLMAQSLRQRQLAQLKEKIRSLKKGHVLVIPHLDLLAGGSANSMSNESRELTELVYSNSDRLILAFTDRSMNIPEVLSARFSVRRMISGVDRAIPDFDEKEKMLGQVLVTPKEKKLFIGFDPQDLYKNVAGMNPIQIRHAITYAVKEHAASGPVPISRLYEAIRAFKVQTSTNFEVPNVTFEDIGGYDDVKHILKKAISLMAGSYKLPDEKLRRELIPRGFIFYGPPGTGKTLFAKAIAHLLDATVQVVSGPEVMDMYVGESERKLREFFAEARRNAPSVLVFDEFDALASKRSGREDGGSRAGNAVVAQLLTEMDGFRPDVPMLVIGTTNRLELIDEALLRPSRFQPIGIGLPDEVARQEIAIVHAKHFKVFEYIEPGLFNVIGRATRGFNGDQIRSIFRDACVGLHCENPPLEINARRLGELVGQIRHNEETRITTATGPDRMSTRPGMQIPGPGGPMINLTDE